MSKETTAPTALIENYWNVADVTQPMFSGVDVNAIAKNVGAEVARITATDIARAVLNEVAIPAEYKLALCRIVAPYGAKIEQ